MYKKIEYECNKAGRNFDCTYCFSYETRVTLSFHAKYGDVDLPTSCKSFDYHINVVPLKILSFMYACKPGLYLCIIIHLISCMKSI